MIARLLPSFRRRLRNPFVYRFIRVPGAGWILRITPARLIDTTFGADVCTKTATYKHP